MSKEDVFLRAKSDCPTCQAWGLVCAEWGSMFQKIDTIWTHLPISIQKPNSFMFANVLEILNDQTLRYTQATEEHIKSHYLDPPPRSE
jgi:hypothetical protein